MEPETAAGRLRGKAERCQVVGARFPGWKMEKCIVLEPGGLHESPKREGTGWERLEPQCYVILRRREAAILRT